jgi:thiol-disulfide isomerase/thioredoxin
MEAIIEKSLQKSMSYLAYRKLVNTLAEQNSTTGDDKTDAHANYTKLNDRRMRRWDKTIEVPKKIVDKLKSFNENMTWLVISESWCGDGAHIIPVINKLSELSRGINFRIVLRDENPELMDTFLTEGNRAIPKLIMIDNKSGDIIQTYGPRPSEATAYVNRFKYKYGKLTSDFKEDLQHWYNNNKGLNIMEDIIEILNEFEPNFSQ